MLRLGGGRTTPGAAGRGVARPQAAATPAASGGQTYWLYNQPGGVQIVAGIEADGKVNSVILSGQSYPAKTEGGVALGDSYKSVLDKYGYPDTTRNAGDALILSYRNAGLTLTLQNLRVQTIALAKPAPLGAAIAPGGPAAPTAPARTGVRPLGPTRPGVARPRTAPGTPGTPGQRPRLRLRLGGGRED
ncbi:MAG: hypothetical protein JSV65_02970 [Armatimonadota bacterium]|nr:MAG: hypothetical protein JSV65_02970 [Armatimonadota bacterium]